MSNMTREQLQYLFNLSLNGGRQPLGSIFGQREQFAEYENAGWLEFRRGEIVDHLALTPKAHRDMNAARFP